MTGWQLQLAAMLGKQQNIGRYIVLQQQYSLLCRDRPTSRKVLTISSMEMRGRMMVLMEKVLRMMLMPGRMRLCEDRASQNTRQVQRILLITVRLCTPSTSGRKHRLDMALSSNSVLTNLCVMSILCVLTIFCVNYSLCVMCILSDNYSLV